MVVDDISQMIGWQFVGAFIEYLVVEYIALHAYVAANYVVHVYVYPWFDFEPNDILLSVFNKRIGFLFRHCQRVSHLHTCVCVVLEVFYFFAFSFQFLGCVEGDVSFSFRKQLVNVFLIYMSAFALSVWAVFSAYAYAFVEFYSEPFKRFGDIFFSSRHESVGVGIFDAEDEFASVLSGEEIVIECGAHAAYV